MVVFPIISLKGGVGKSTTSLNISDLLALQTSYKVILIDTDPQNSVSFLLCKPLKKGLSEFLEGEVEIKDIIQKSFDNGFDFISCGFFSIKNFNQYENNFKPKNIKKMLSFLEKEGYDIVIFDTPPQISSIVDTLITLKDFFGFVTTPEPASVASFKVFLDFLDKKGIGYDEFGVIVNKIEPTELNEDFYMYIKTLIDNIIMTLPKDELVVKSEANCTTVVRLEEESAYLEFLKEGIEQILKYLKLK